MKKINTIFHIVLLIIVSGIFICSCTSSTAIKGTPVNQVKLPEDKRFPKRLLKGKTKEEIYALSNVTENKTFKNINGVPEYRIGPLDVLEITSRVGDKSSTTTITVNTRGMISYSFLDDIYVNGLTPSEVDRILTEKLSQYIKKPRIDVLVKEFKSKKAIVMGEFTSIRSAAYGTKRASGIIYLKGKTTLMDLISLAGGYTVDGDIKNTKLIRKGKPYIINLYDIIEKGDQRLNIIIDDGDIVEIPELPEFGERVYVMGEVASQGVYALKDVKDLLGAVSLAGGFTPLAKEENTLIIRAMGPGKKPLVMMADLKALFRKADITQNIPLEDGDLVYVPRMLIGDINEWINNHMPLLNFLFYPHEFESRYFLRQYLHFDRR